MPDDDHLDRRRWQEQKWRARNRGIPFRLTYQQWRDWWLAELAKIGSDARRGRQLGEWLMCRPGDAGAYELGNIYCGDRKQNAADVPPEKLARGSREWRAAGNVTWLKGRTGTAHPRSKAIYTPAGVFPSLTAAATHYGISRTEIRRRMANRQFSYV
jgi:hypothetical protein